MNEPRALAHFVVQTRAVGALEQTTDIADIAQLVAGNREGSPAREVRR